MRSILLALALAVAAPAQNMFDVQFPTNCIATACVWNGKPAVIVTMPMKGGNTAALWWYPGVTAIFRTTMTLVGWYAADSRPCACGELVYVSQPILAAMNATKVGTMCWPQPGYAMDLSRKRTFRGHDQFATSLVLDYIGDGQPQQKCNGGPYHPEMACLIFEVGLR